MKRSSDLGGAVGAIVFLALVQLGVWVFGIWEVTHAAVTIARIIWG